MKSSAKIGMSPSVHPISGSKVSILGVEVDAVDMPGAIRILEEFIQARTPRLIATADSSGIVQAQTDPELREIYGRADLVTPDSHGVLWAARRQGVALPERVSGVDLLEALCRLSAEKGYRLAFLGAAPGVAELAAERLRLKYPGCHIVGARHGYFPPESDEVVAEEIAALRPDALFVAMGIPRQEKFILKTQSIIGAPVAMGVGGSLDVFSGKTRRAPKLFQRLKLEWLWRLLLNPKKIGKVMALPRFALLVLRSPKGGRS